MRIYFVFLHPALVSGITSTYRYYMCIDTFSPGPSPAFSRFCACRLLHHTPQKKISKRYLCLTTERICSTIGSTNTAVGPRCILPGHIHV